MGDVAPVSGSQSGLFDSAINGDTSFFKSEFTVASNQVMLCQGSGVFMRFGNGGDLTVETGGILDFTSGGTGTIDYAYDQGGGDLGIALTLDIEPFVAWALSYGLRDLNGDQPGDVNNTEGINNINCYGFGLNPTNGLAADGALPELGSDASGLVYVVAQRNDDPACRLFPALPSGIARHHAKL